MLLLSLCDALSCFATRTLLFGFRWGLTRSSSILLAIPLIQYYSPDGSSRRGFLSRVLFLLFDSSELLCEPTRTRWANCAAASNHAPARPQRSRATGSAAVAAMSDEDSSDDGSYAESADGESESDDEIIEEPAVPEHPRPAAELTAALDDAPDEEIRAMMREARPLRTDGDLPRDLLRAFGGRVPRLCIPSPPGVKGGIRQDVNSWALSAALASSQVLDFSLNFLLVLDEHLILVSVHAGVATLFGYDRYVVDDVFKRHGRLTLGTAGRVELNTDIVPIVEEQLFTSSQDVHLDEKALSYTRGTLSPMKTASGRSPGCRSPTAAFITTDQRKSAADLQQPCLRIPASRNSSCETWRMYFLATWSCCTG